ncbi:hypothetical protein [Rummeliibacillus pycnus]|uniref:hypothetical protein n=1 Tax=Rummeliibacillus pycnus TaxID=101070 RepID=UPI003D28648A
MKHKFDKLEFKDLIPNDLILSEQRKQQIEQEAARRLHSTKSILKWKPIMLTITLIVTAVLISLTIYKPEKNILQGTSNFPTENIVVKKNINNTIKEKTNLQTLMLNSFDHFTTAKGSFDYYSQKGKYHLLVEYQADLSDNPWSYEKVQDLSFTPQYRDVSKENVIGYEEYKYYGENLIKIDHTKKGAPTTTSVRTNKISKTERNYLKGSTIDERIVVDENGEKNYIRRSDPAYLGVSKMSLLPEDFTMTLLENKNEWNIISTGNMLGLTTIIVEGNLTREYQNNYNAKTFRLEIAEETGVLLKLVMKDEKGKVTEAMITRDIQFDKSLNSEVLK